METEQSTSSENGDSNMDTLATQLDRMSTPRQEIGETESFGQILSNPFLPSTSAVISNDNDAWYYNMNHKHRGIAIIFNHKHFDDQRHSTRNGTEADCFSLGSTLNSFGFNVTTYTDLTSREIDEKIEYWAKMDYTDHDCIFVVVLSHGNPGIIYARDVPYEPEFKLWGKFTGKKCPTLAGKPKLFFIQACRGEGLDGGVMLTHAAQADGGPMLTEPTQVDGGSMLKQATQVASRPMLKQATQVDGGPLSFKVENADFLIAYSTVPGFFSWRNSQGSWFIQELSKALEKYGHQHDLLTILTLVNRQVSIYCESNHSYSWMHCKKQIPCFVSRLTKLVQFVEKKK